MSEKILSKLNQMTMDIRKVIASHLSFFVVLLACFVAVAFDGEEAIIAAPLCAVFSLALDYFLSDKWKHLSWIVAVIYLVSLCFPDILDLVDCPEYYIVTFVLLPLVVLLYQKKTKDENFISGGLWTLWSMFLSGLIVGCLCAVIAGILLCVQTLFGADIDFFEYIAEFALIVIAPLLFVYFTEHEDMPKINSLVELIVNWIISPGVVIYTAILLVYAAKILFTWTLPCGGVAVMCFVWGIVTMFVIGAQGLLTKKPFKWYGNIYKYISIPMLILLYVAIGRRISDYGITAARYYLVICGIIMTAFILISLMNDDRKYYRMTAVTALIVLASIACPLINYRNVCVKSQLSIARGCAEKLNLLSEDGQIDIPENVVFVEKGEKGTYERMVSALGEIKDIKPKMLQKIGIGNFNAVKNVKVKEGVSPAIPSEDSENGLTFSGSARLRGNTSVCDISKYRKLTMDPKVNISENEAGEKIIDVNGHIIKQSDFFKTQLAKLGNPKVITSELLEENVEKWLEYEGNNFKVIFDELELFIYIDKNGKYSLEFGSVYDYPTYCSAEMLLEK